MDRIQKLYEDWEHASGVIPFPFPPEENKMESLQKFLYEAGFESVSVTLESDEFGSSYRVEALWDNYYTGRKT